MVFEKARNNDLAYLSVLQMFPSSGDGGLVAPTMQKNGTVLEFYGKFFEFQIRWSGTGSAKQITHDSVSFWERLWSALFFREKWHKAIEFISYSQIGAHLGLAELMGLEPVADQKQVIFAEQ